MAEQPLHFSNLNTWLTTRVNAARWCVAFSGGPDSTVLLHLLQCWRSNQTGDTPPLVAVHVNHGMQDDADAWQAHCEALCHSWNIPIIVHRATVENAGQGAEAAARQARYQHFETEIKAGDVLFMGHHLDDQVETFFLRLMRGSGLIGLSAMPQRRELGGGELIRPLLKMQRSMLQNYLAVHQLSAIQDPSNLDTSLDRNYLRQTVLPLLEERWGGYRQTVARAAEHAAVSQTVVNECLPVPKTVFSVMGDPGIEQRELNSVSVDAGMIKLRRWLRSGGYPMPDQLLLKEFMRQLREGAATSSPRLTCSSFALQRYQNRVYLLPEFPGSEGGVTPSQPLVLNPGEVCKIAGVGEVGIIQAEGAGLDLTSEDSLALRWRAGGERCRPRGSPYHQRLKKLFQEHAVPPWWRERVPLLYLGDELLAVGGLWLCESSRLRQETALPDGLWQLYWQRKPCAFD